MCLKEKMKVVMVEPGQYARITELEDTLEAKQRAVGGLITCAYPWEENVCIIANDEGLINGMPLNRYVEDYQVLAGPFFVCGLTKDAFCGLTDEQAERYRKVFEKPELFLWFKDHILPVPYDDPHLPDAPKEVSARIRQRGGFPDLCFVVLPGTSALIMIQYGENGYLSVGPQPGYGRGQVCADALNEKMGVSKAQVSAMLYASILDWNTTIIPALFDKNGNPRPPKQKKPQSKKQEER